MYLEEYRKPDSGQDKLDLFYTMAALIIVFGVLYIFLYHPYFFKMTRKGMQLRSDFISKLNRKELIQILTQN